VLPVSLLVFRLFSLPSITRTKAKTHVLQRLDDLLHVCDLFVWFHGWKRERERAGERESEREREKERVREEVEKRQREGKNAWEQDAAQFGHLPWRTWQS
jgi:hypothetical protein